MIDEDHSIPTNVQCQLSLASWRQLNSIMLVPFLEYCNKKGIDVNTMSEYLNSIGLSVRDMHIEQLHTWLGILELNEKEPVEKEAAKVLIAYLEEIQSGPDLVVPLKEYGWQKNCGAKNLLRFINKHHLSMGVLYILANNIPISIASLSEDQTSILTNDKLLTSPDASKLIRNLRRKDWWKDFVDNLIFEKNLIVKDYVNSLQSLNDIIANAFNWNDTLEGFDFWATIEQSIKRTLRSLPTSSEERFTTILKTEANSHFDLPLSFREDYFPELQANKTSVNSKKTFKNNSPDIERIEFIKDKVEPKLIQWSNKKQYRRHIITYESVSKQITVPIESLKFYFKYVEPIGLHNWVDSLRINEAKQSLHFFVDKYFQFIPSELGFGSKDEFVKAFEKCERLSPDIWRKNKSIAIQSGDDELSPKFSKIIDKVTTAYNSWVSAKGYHKRYFGPSYVADDLKVSLLELYLFCDWILHTDIISQIIDLRIEEAKQILIDHPLLEIKEVARRVGYAERGAFYEQFEWRTGLYPAIWRDKILTEKRGKAPVSQPPERKASPFDDETIIEWKRKKGFCQPHLTLSIVAKQVDFSELRLNHYLQQVVKKSFAEWILDLRLEEAKRILINRPSLTTAQVARQIGFTGKGGFSVWFAQQTGMTPESWKAGVLSKEMTRAEAGVKGTTSIPYSIRKLIDSWVKEKGYCHSGLSQSEAATEIGITEDQLVAYCYSCGKLHFPSWLSQLRIKESQRLLITYPSMQIVDIARKVGYSDVKVFRLIFEKITQSLPTEWRKEYSKKPVAEVLAAIEEHSQEQFALDPEKLKNVESTTSEVHELLSDIFVDEENDTRKEDNQRADDAVMKLLPALLKQEKWLKADFEALCKTHSLLPGFAIERINEIVYEKIGDTLVDDWGETIYIALDYKDLLI